MLDRSTLKKLAARAGFDLCGVAPCRHLAEGERRFRRWLEQGCQASLGYMERNADKRFDPRLLLDGARTAVVCAVSYRNRASEGYPAGHRAKVASYACARDYHATIREMLENLYASVQEIWPDVGGRIFVDTAPLAEKQLAVEAGLGWIGRQSLLVTPGFGTCVLLGELLLCDETESYDAPLDGPGCGDCRRCIDSCPTQAISDSRTIDARHCISCHTIEREPSSKIDLHGWIFGCDACQNCCPYNLRAPRHTHPAFDPLFDPVAMTPDEWAAMDEAQFAARFGSTPLARSGLQRIRQHVALQRADASDPE